MGLLVDPAVVLSSLFLCNAFNHRDFRNYNFATKTCHISSNRANLCHGSHFLWSNYEASQPMIIRSPADFAAFLRGAGLVNLSADTSRMVCCLDEYARMCACDPPEAKTAKYNQCKEYYINFVCQSVAYKGHLMAKTGDNHLSFYNGNQQIITLSR